jgi:MFS family permease
MKVRSVGFLVAGEILAMSLWFVSAAVLPEMLREAPLGPTQIGLMSSGVQGGFVVGALAFAAIGLPDRFDPRLIFALSALFAAAANAVLLVATPGSGLAIMMRFMTGLMLAGVYPVGMKIAVGWGIKDRGFLVGLIVGALTLGSAAPHLFSWLGGADWRTVVAVTSAAAVFGGGLVLLSSLGPYHAQAPRFDPRALRIAWQDRRIRYAYCGYLGHMWELYAMWAWIGTITATSYAASLPATAATELGKLSAFFAIAAGGIASVGAGFVADRFGKAETTIVAMAISGTAAILTALSFGGPVWVTLAIVIVWGAAIVPDSAQFSAIVADSSPPSQAGSLMTFQTALGFALTFVTVQITPVLADMFGWPWVIAGLALGPGVGILAMIRLLRLPESHGPS